MNRDAAQALQAIGSNAVPTLLWMMRVPDSDVELHSQTPEQWIQLQQSARERGHGDPAPYLHREALAGFDALGPAAKSAVPDLITLYETNTSPNSRHRVLQGLMGIDPEANAAVPFLIKAVTNSYAAEPNEREYVFMTLLTIARQKPELDQVVFALVSHLRDTDAQARIATAEYLSVMRTNAAPAVPTLFELLKDPNLPVRQAAAGAIMSIDPDQAKRRMPELRAATQQEKQ